MVGSQSLLPPNPTFGSKQTKFEEKFQTDFWFICHLQIKATVTAVACQRPGRDRVQALFVISERMAGRGGYRGSLGVHKGAERGVEREFGVQPEQPPMPRPPLTQSHHCPPVAHFSETRAGKCTQVVSSFLLHPQLLLSIPFLCPGRTIICLLTRV